ncbi:MAG: hypothetical protein ACHQPH_21275 [Reyranellales bacterium]|jgi:hypothetical protein
MLFSRSRSSAICIQVAVCNQHGGSVPVKSGNRTVGFLFPLKAADPDRLAAVLARAEALAKRRDPTEDDAALAAMAIDPTDWSVEAVHVLKSGCC